MLIYLIPGVAADQRLFEKLHLPGYELRNVLLPHSQKGATMKDYADAMESSIDKECEHALVGVSMGGMLAQELAPRTHPRKVIIISSWKGPDEMPMALKALRGTHPERIVTRKFIERILPMLYWQMGAENDEDRRLIDDFLHAMPVEQIKHQLHASLNWSGPAMKFEPLVHLHGDNDHLMPISDIKGAVPVKGGGHIMVFNRARELSSLLKEHLPGSDHETRGA